VRGEEARVVVAAAGEEEGTGEEEGAGEEGERAVERQGQRGGGGMRGVSAAGLSWA
jgi:hypothetical protein